MAELKTRIQLRHDTEENWIAVGGSLVPLAGEACLTTDGENKGRQTLDNVKALSGYYITNGKAIEITAEKSSRASQTVYKDLEGNEIEVNDGNTFIQICPIDSKVVIEPGKPEVTEVTNVVNE